MTIILFEGRRGGGMSFFSTFAYTQYVASMIEYPWTFLMADLQDPMFIDYKMSKGKVAARWKKILGEVH